MQENLQSQKQANNAETSPSYCRLMRIEMDITLKHFLCYLNWAFGRGMGVMWTLVTLAEISGGA